MTPTNPFKGLNKNVAFVVMAFFAYKGIAVYNYHNSYEYKLKKYNDCFRMMEKEVLGKRGDGVFKLYEMFEKDINSGQKKLEKVIRHIPTQDLIISCMRLRVDTIKSLVEDELPQSGEGGLYIDTRYIHLEEVDATKKEEKEGQIMNDEWIYEIPQKKKIPTNKSDKSR